MPPPASGFPPSWAGRKCPLEPGAGASWVCRMGEQPRGQDGGAQGTPLVEGVLCLQLRWGGAGHSCQPSKAGLLGGGGHRSFVRTREPSVGGAGSGAGRGPGSGAGSLRRLSRSLSRAAPPAAARPPGRPAPWPLSSGSGPHTPAWGPGGGEQVPPGARLRGPHRPRAPSPVLDDALDDEVRGEVVPAVHLAEDAPPLGLLGTRAAGR